MEMLSGISFYDSSGGRSLRHLILPSKRSIFVMALITSGADVAARDRGIHAEFTMTTFLRDGADRLRRCFPRRKM